MKKKMTFLILLIIFSSFFILHKNITNGATKNDNDDDAMDKYGYKITIIRYNGKGEPEQIKKPILVYQKGLLGDVVGSHNKGDFPSSYSDYSTNKYPVTQFVDKTRKNTEYVSAKRGEGGYTESSKNIAKNQNTGNESTDARTQKNVQTDTSNGKTYAHYIEILGKEKVEEITGKDFDTSLLAKYVRKGASADDPNEVVGDPITESQLEAAMGEDYVFYELMVSKGCPDGIPASNFKAGHSGYMDHIVRYMTNGSIASYPGFMIPFDEYYAVYEEKILDTATIVAFKYAGTAKAIKDNFGITLDPMKLKEYYIQVEPVQRVLETRDEYQLIVGSYQAGMVENIVIDETSWTANPSDWISIPGEERCKTGWIRVGNMCYICSSACKDLGCSSDCKYVVSTGHTTYSKDNAPCEDGKADNFVKGSYDIELKAYKYTYSCIKNYTDKKEAVEELFRVNNCRIGERERVYFYGTIRVSPSYIMTSREINGQFIDKASNSCKNNDNKHDVYDSYDRPTGEYLYYIGPNLEDALVGPAKVDPKDSRLKGISYKYKLNDVEFNSNGKNKYSNYECNKNGNPQLGIQHIYLIDIIELCSECNKLGDKSSPEFLKCAEQYAEAKVDYDTKGNVQKRKQTIILDVCKYTYGISPTDGTKTNPDRESKNSCNNSASKYIKGITYVYNTKANKVNSSSVCNVPNSKGVYISPCYGDYITDFDGNSKNENPQVYDHRLYINKVCKSSTSFEFKNTSKMELSKGSGFTYPIIQEGEEECTYFFNSEQWMVDYATAPARDPYARKRLEYILNKFNAAVSNEDVDANGVPTDDIERYGNTKYESNVFDFNNTQINLSIKEYLTTNDKSKNTILNTVTDKKNITPVKLQTIGNDTVTRIANGKITTGIPVNRYISVSEGNVTKALEKACISTDGQATISRNIPSNGVCFQQKSNKGETINVYAERKYYTSFQIDPDKTNEINASVTVGKDGNYYYKNDEKCTYSINSPYSCHLEVVDTPGLEKLGNKQYKANELKIGIHYQIPNSLIDSVSILDNNNLNTLSLSQSEITIKNRRNLSIDAHYVEGKIKLKNGDTVPCSISVELIGGGSCKNLSCEIVKINDTLYEITSTGSKGATRFYTYSSNHITPSFDEIINQGNGKYAFMKEVIKDVKTQRRFIRLSEALAEGEALYGYVTTDDELCNNSCMVIPKPKTYDCRKEFPNPTGLDLEIQEYCSIHGNEDINGFKDKDECFSFCSGVQRRCPNECDDLKKVESFCENASDLGYPGTDAKQLCMNECFCPNTREDDDYLFRSIDVFDPFPNSDESVSQYTKGIRLIGKNWRFLSEKYIINDSNDKTAVTGPNKNEAVEYIIDINAKDIKSIRKSIDDSETNTLNNKRKVYAQLYRVSTNSKELGPYKSEFIRSKYSGLFQQSHGDIPASFLPGNN